MSDTKWTPAPGHEPQIKYDHQFTPEGTDLPSFRCGWAAGYEHASGDTRQVCGQIAASPHLEDAPMDKQTARMGGNVPGVDELAQFIRATDGSNQMGAAVLAEHICTWLSERSTPQPDEPSPIEDLSDSLLELAIESGATLLPPMSKDGDYEDRVQFYKSQLIDFIHRVSVQHLKQVVSEPSEEVSALAIFLHGTWLMDREPEMLRKILSPFNVRLSDNSHKLDSSSSPVAMTARPPTATEHDILMKASLRSGKIITEPANKGSVEWRFSRLCEELNKRFPHPDPFSSAEIPEAHYLRAIDEMLSSTPATVEREVTMDEYLQRGQQMRDVPKKYPTLREVIDRIESDDSIDFSKEGGKKP